MAVNRGILNGLANTGVGRFAGGTTGQVLAKGSDENFDTRWISTFEPRIVAKPGAFVGPGGAQTGGLTGAITIDPNNNNFTRLFLWRTFTFDQIICEIKNTGTNRKAKMGVWTDINNAPSIVVIDSGEFDTSTAGTKTISLPQPVTLPPGNYWVGFYPQATTSVEGCTSFAFPVNAAQNQWQTSLEGGGSYPTNQLPNYPFGSLGVNIPFQNKPPWIRLRILS